MMRGKYRILESFPSYFSNIRKGDVGRVNFLFTVVFEKMFLAEGV